MDLLDFLDVPWATYYIDYPCNSKDMIMIEDETDVTQQLIDDAIIWL